MNTAPVIPTCRPHPDDLGRFRTSRRSAPRQPYEVLSPADVWSEIGLAAAQAVVEDGWRFRSRPLISVQPPIAWQEVCATDRSWEFHLHCWDFLGPVLAAFEETGARRWLEFALSVAVDWCRRHPGTVPHGLVGHGRGPTHGRLTTSWRVGVE